MKTSKLRYVLGALPQRFTQPNQCPGCDSTSFARVDRKGLHELHRCGECALLYRWPYESAAAMAKFYQREYSQPGLTTDLPDARTLEQLTATGFRGSSKDFSPILELFEEIGVPSEARVLDYGANWGYAVWQFREAGFDAIGFELSRPRAEFSKRLGVDIYTEWADVMAQDPFDVVFSSHVLEHTPDPAVAINEQLSALRPDGFLVALFPNGSELFRQADPKAFHRLWGRVHPVMLNDEFALKILGDQIVFLGSLAAPALAGISRANGPNRTVSNLATSEMLLIARKRPAPASPMQRGQ